MFISTPQLAFEIRIDEWLHVELALLATQTGCLHKFIIILKVFFPFLDPLFLFGGFFFLFS
jgi:hypothetical protein